MDDGNNLGERSSEQTNRLFDLDDFIAIIRQIDVNMRDNERPGAEERRLELLRLANEYLQAEWTEIKSTLDEIFDIRYGITLIIFTTYCIIIMKYISYRV